MHQLNQLLYPKIDTVKTNKPKHYWTRTHLVDMRSKCQVQPHAPIQCIRRYLQKQTLASNPCLISLWLLSFVFETFDQYPSGWIREFLICWFYTHRSKRICDDWNDFLFSLNRIILCSLHFLKWFLGLSVAWLWVSTYALATNSWSPHAKAKCRFFAHSKSESSPISFYSVFRVESIEK